MSSSHRDVDALSGALLGFGTIIVGLRFLARHLQKGQYTADDWLMVFSYIFFVGFMASALYATHHHVLGYSIDETLNDPPTPQLEVANFFALNIYAAAYFGCVKASALCFFERVFCVHEKREVFRYIVWFMLAVTGIWAVYYILLPTFQCGTKLSNHWAAPDVQAETCKSATAIVESSAVTDMVFDIIILVLPIPKIRTLEISLQRRLGVIFVFATAIVSLAASIAKTVIYYQIYDGQITGDPLSEATVAYFMWILEAGFAMLAVNMPSLVWFRASKAPEKMLATVRSFLSIGSRSSGGSHRTGRTTWETSRNPSHSGSVQAGLHAHQHEPMPHGGILVQHEVKHEYEQV